MSPMAPAPSVSRLAGIVFVALITAISWGQNTSDPSMSDIFFLDLGIVIEPVTGNEQYSRLVESPSEEVQFRINKIQSGAVYMATSQEMLGTLDRINLRIAALEQSFHSEMDRLRLENKELRGILATMQNTRTLASIQPPQVKEVPAVAEQPVEKNKPQPDVSADIPEHQPAPRPKFDQSAYMAGVFAYQREDFSRALDHFSGLIIVDVSPRTRSNILYWMADAHQRLGENQQALILLESLLANGIGDRQDDALIQKGLLHRKLGEETLALQFFERLVDEYPTSEYVKLARMELKKAEMVP